MIRLLGDSLPSLPWQERPADCGTTVWRYDGNPVVRRDALSDSNSIFNSAVVPFRDGFAGIFRVDDQVGGIHGVKLHAGFSKDGIHWKLDEKKIEFSGGVRPFEYGFDPRIAKIGDVFYITWCNGYFGEPTIGLAKTVDFRTFEQMENIFLPYNRNGVLFPRKINGMYCLLSRPSDNGNTPFGDIYLSRSPDLRFWGEHRLVMKTEQGWQRTKIGAGPVPIETTEGWLLFYHGVCQSCCGFRYSFGAALLDLDEPWKVIARDRRYLMSPQTLYECTGDVPNVVFPCAALTDPATGRIAIYYGAADTCVGLAFCRVEEVFTHMERLKK